MANISFEYKDTCLIKESEIITIAQQLIPEIEYVQDQIGNGYTHPSGLINVPADGAMREAVATLVHAKRKLSPAALVVCGIGGSNLGTRAIVEAIYGTFYNYATALKIFFADTVDNTYISSIACQVEEYLKEGEKILLNVVTKSGTTTETIANFEIFLGIIKKYHPNDYHEYIIVTTDYDSPLQDLAQQYNFSLLPIPQNIGGRYSVFSAVGQFPLAIIGIDIDELLQGAQDSVQYCTSTEVENNPAALSAVIKYLHYKQNNININDLFVFSVQLDAVGRWYRQLMAESLGKEFDMNGDKVDIGITPTVSVGSTDLHSVGQLYLGGPHDKFITFISVKEHKEPLCVPRMPEFKNLVANIQGKTLPCIMDAILKGVKEAYKKNKRPFCSIALPTLSPYSIGQLLQCYMIEMFYLGYLLNINPFDQPHVELYKEETRKLL